VETQPRLLCTRAAAAYTGDSKSTFEKRRTRGEGPPFISRPGTRAYYYDVRDLDAWIDQQRRFTSAAEVNAAFRAQRSSQKAKRKAPEQGAAPG
jgi:hypothetical protein